MNFDKLIPDQPSGFNGECRSKLSMAADAGDLGLSALTPPIVGVAGPLVSGGQKIAENVKAGNVGDAIGTLIGTLPTAAAGFFGGGAAANVARGLTNEGVVALGARRENLPGSSAENLAEDITCRKPAAIIEQAPVPEVHGKKFTKTSDSKSGWKTTITFNP